jgi:hypothetical protein
VITGHDPAMEGDIAVAPASFGRYGGDIGVESSGFMPPRLSAGDAAYLADRSPTPAVSPRRPVAPGAGAGGRLTDVLPEVATCFQRAAGTPRPQLMTEADQQVRTTVLCFGAALGVPGLAHCYTPRRW